MTDSKISQLESKWQTNTEKGAKTFCEGIAKIAGVPVNELENATNSICERYKEGIKNKAEKWKEGYLSALLEGTEEVRKE